MKRLSASAGSPPKRARRQTRSRASPPRLKSAAAFLPLEILTGGKVTGITAQMAPATGVSKLVAFLAFPAVSVFVLLGATIFSFAKIRSIQQQKSTAVADAEAMNRAISAWWRRHWWGAGMVYGSTFGLSMFGATWLLFLVYIVSFGLLVYILASLGKLGLGNRVVIGQSCLWGLLFLRCLAPGSGSEMRRFTSSIKRWFPPSLTSAFTASGYSPGHDRRQHGQARFDLDFRPSVPSCWLWSPSG